MSELADLFDRAALFLIGAASIVAVAMILIVLIGRIAVAAYDAWLRRQTARYAPLVARALGGDQAARALLAASPSRHHFPIARLLLLPLIGDRNPVHIATAREILASMSLIRFASRLVHSPWWWRRSLGIRVLGGLQVTDHTAPIVAALDDPNSEVRNTALDALADMQNPAALPAIVVRLHDSSLPRARRAAALAAFGPRCEEFLLDLAGVDVEHRVNYARALSICGTETSRPALRQWVDDPRPEVCAAALHALSRIGLDRPCALAAMDALESSDVNVRAMAATALHGSTEPGAAARLARHLDDAWPVAVSAARALREMNDEGRRLLEARANGTDLVGLLARQMLWEWTAS